MERAGMSGGVQTVELLGWKIVCAMLGTAIGLWFVFELGAPGLLLLVLTAAMGWFGIDVLLAHYHNQRRTLILRDLPTVMDLLVLSLEAGMGLDRALRTATAEYRSALSDEIGRVLRDVDLGLSRGEAFQRMADRVDLDDLRSLSRAIVQSEELGVSLVSVMQTQTREVRVSRRRAAEAEALRAPIKMLVPLVVFILPTLFMLLIGPVGLRAANALSGAP
jgi:tight adherence protein C